MYDSKGIFMVD